MTASAWTAGSSGIIPHVTHALLEKLLRKGEVRLDGKRAKAADRIAAGQAMRLPPQVIHAKAPQTQKPEAEPKHLLASKDMGSLADRILYMDKQVIVIDKPPGLATQGGSGLTKHVDGMLDSPAIRKTHAAQAGASPGPRYLRRAADRAHGAGGVGPFGQPGAARHLQGLLGADPRRAASRRTAWSRARWPRKAATARMAATSAWR